MIVFFTACNNVPKSADTLVVFCSPPVPHVEVGVKASLHIAFGDANQPQATSWLIQQRRKTPTTPFLLGVVADLDRLALESPVPTEKQNIVNNCHAHVFEEKCVSKFIIVK